MTAVLTVTCDRCRRPVETDRHLIRFDSGSARDRRPQIDLCRGCAGWLLATLDRLADALGLELRETRRGRPGGGPKKAQAADVVGD